MPPEPRPKPPAPRERRAQPQYPERREHPRSNRRWVYLALALALVVAAAAAAAIVLARDDSGVATETVADGLPQEGMVLGDADAPVTLVEYADFQCPFCREFAVSALPGIVDEYVRPGEVKIELRGLAFLGPDSELALDHVVAAAEDDRAWQVADLLFQEQGPENSGWVTDELLREIEEAAGLDPEQVAERAAGEDVARQVRDEDARAQQLGIDSTPSFLIGPSGGELRPFTVNALALSEFEPVIEEELQQARD